MIGVRIDPHTRTVTRFETDLTGLAAIRAAIGDVTVTRVGLGQGVDLWLDDEGLLGDQSQQRYWTFIPQGGTPVPYAGRGVVLGLDGWGETVDAPPYVTPAILAAAIMWLGDEIDLEIAIRAGHVIRPERAVTGILADGRQTRVVEWSWSSAAWRNEA